MGLGRAGRAYGKERVCALPGGALSQPRAQTLSQTPLGPNTEIQLTLAMQTADGRAPCFHAGGVGVLPTPSSVAKSTIQALQCCDPEPVFTGLGAGRVSGHTTGARAHIWYS